VKAIANRSKIPFINCSVDALTMEETVALINSMIGAGGSYVHACVNAGKIVEMSRDERLMSAINAANLVSADGQSIVWGASLLGHHLPERVAGIDLMVRLLREAEGKGYSIYLLGAQAEVLQDLAKVLQRSYPCLKIAGFHHGYFSATEETVLIEDIKNSHPDILFLGMSSPAKELWLEKNRQRLAVPFAMGVGGSFDVLAGRHRRAPAWAQRAGLEWAFRLVQEPRRMWRRYLLGNAVFLWMLGRALLARTRSGSR
jgi:N-acetylglucosaminyldiphosphoundecaprenol N-acetyl-beta-D-mannosaminyltransferase